ncbi:MAG TPA: manganese catalase family protein [Candidatus Caccousia avicola]|uniref:Manganese catalase family protein n=1 Tax=Candidatus Caccousia avicola TaxID=2840721 RepID=A0A9D1AQR9_9FIRM|nr:manganese catalase family protein [Candidatus Caccousia avicola]
MWVYEKKLQYPIRIKNPNPALAKLICAQYGGPNGELGASLRYLSQRYTMPYPELKAILTDIGTEELGHLEMVGTIVYQLTRNLTPQQIKEAGFDSYFIDHTTGVYPADANGVPFSAGSFAVTGDAITDLHENMAAEQKARTTYDNILRFCDDPDVRDPIRFLREREVVHYQRFGEGLRLTTDKLDSKNFYAFNPEFDRKR